MTTSTHPRPNELSIAFDSLNTGRLHRRWPIIMTILRLLLFPASQALIALVYFLLGARQAWEQSIAWWPMAVTLTNLVCIYLLVRLYRLEGLRYRDLFHFDRQHLGKDLLVVFGALIITGPIAMLPNIWLANTLFGDPQNAADLMFRSLPLWAAVLSFILFPLTQGLAELPTYFGYAAPRLSVLWGSRVTAILFTSLFLGLQHATLPLIFEWRFIVWRAFMYLPFALWLAVLLNWRPRLLPYFAVIHILLDFSAVWFTLAASLS